MADTKENRSKKELLAERMRGRYPDMNFDDEEAYYGQIYDDYEQYDQNARELDERRENERKLGDMFTSDPRSARLMLAWRDGDDPVIALLRMYGEDILEAVNDPERQEEIAKANKEYLAKVSKEKEYEEQHQTNLTESLEMLAQYQNERGLRDDDIDTATGWLIKMAHDVMMGKFTPEMVDMALKAQNYDSAVAEAGESGEVRGRNARIEEKLRKPAKGDGTAQLDGKNGGQRNRAATPDLGAIDRYADGNMSIFERGGEKRRPIKR